MSNIHGLGSVGKDKNDKKENEEFSLGGKTSSTAVYRPTGSGNDTNADLIRQARGAGGVSGAPPGEVTARITLYANGFIVDDGEFQDTESNPANKMFLFDLKKGVVPQGMEAQIKAKMNGATGNPVVAIDDKTSETYEPPTPAFNFDSSHGQSLGGPSSVTDLSSLSPQEYKCDENDATTTLQLVTHDRKRKRAKFNHSATVAQVYQHVMSLTGKSSFSLMGGFPPKPLKDYNASLKEAGLLGASVSQRL